MFAVSIWYSVIHRTPQALSIILGSLLFVACGGGGGGGGASTSAQAAGTPGAEQAVGERLFMETGFAQAFKTLLDAGGNVNDPNAGDPVVDTEETTGAPIDPSPFKGLSMNCRACHIVDDVLTAPGGGMRTYASLAGVRFQRGLMARLTHHVIHLRSSIQHWIGQVGSSSISIRSSTRWKSWLRPLSQGGTSGGSR